MNSSIAAQSDDGSQPNTSPDSRPRTESTGSLFRSVSFANTVEKATTKRKSLSKPIREKSAELWNLPPQYKIEERLGKGAYGSVCQAQDSKAARLVAIKRIQDLFSDLEDARRILREIAILSSLHSDWTAQIYDVFITRELSCFDEICIVMELCETDMRMLFKTNTVLKISHVRLLLFNLLAGCNYIHSAGVFHRDLKPANCLVNSDCSLKICDFGLARALGDYQDWKRSGSVLSMDPLTPATPPAGTGADSLQQGDQNEGERPQGESRPSLVRSLTNHVVTRWYRAPELILLQDEYSEQIDLWAAGCIFGEMLGMLHDRVRERAPLFPGSACFPLSPAAANREAEDHFHHRGEGRHDQLSTIFGYIGTPTEQDISCLQRDAQRYVRRFPAKEGSGFKQRFVEASNEALDLLDNMLKFDAQQRMSVDGCLSHSFLHKTGKRPVAVYVGPRLAVALDDDKVDELTQEVLRAAFQEEVLKFHPELSAKSSTTTDPETEIGVKAINSGACARTSDRFVFGDLTPSSCSSLPSAVTEQLSTRTRQRPSGRFCCCRRFAQRGSGGPLVASTKSAFDFPYDGPTQNLSQEPAGNPTETKYDPYDDPVPPSGELTVISI